MWKYKIFNLLLNIKVFPLNDLKMKLVIKKNNNSKHFIFVIL